MTGDHEFMRDYGAEIVLSTALFWGSRIEKNPQRNEYEINDVIGPDEWQEHGNNNTFTNSMARWNLQTALDMLNWLRQYAPDKAKALEQQLDLRDHALDYWRGVHPRTRSAR